MKPCRWRDIHLDFHTHGDIDDIGADFDPDEFAGTLQAAAVDSICVFTRCHHGYCYYPTTVGTPHPHLARPDLLGDMVRTLRAHNISVGAYTTVVWDELTWQQHPDWRVVLPNGKFQMDGGPGWKWLCMNTPYVDWLEAHTREFLGRHEFDRLFVDIILNPSDGCVCDHCLRTMRAEGLDPESARDRRIHGLRVRSRFIERYRAVVDDCDPEMPVFFNRGWHLSSHPESTVRRDLHRYGYLTIESLPSGFWGYNHFPLLAGYFLHRGLDVQSHTGRFHRMWGDFGGLKNPAALEYECFRMVAWGAKCGIGDQLHPRGRLEPATYELVGSVYRQIAALEPWLADTTGLADVAVLVGVGTDGDLFASDLSSEEGAMRMLLELGLTYQVVDADDPLEGYEVLLLPDAIHLDDALAAKVRAFIDGGGRVIASYRSGLDPAGRQFVLGGWPASWLGDGESTAHYLRPRAAAGPDLAEFDYVVYQRGGRITADDGAAVLADQVEPYFERRAQHFCSHAQTPPTGEPVRPAAVQAGAITYFADPLFRLYRETGHRVYKLLVRNALQRALPRPVLRHELPSTAEVTVRRQGDRHIVHLLHYVPQRRANIDLIEDVLPLHDVRFGLRLDAPPASVTLAPSGTALPWRYEDGYAWVELPRVDGHAHVVFG